MKHLGVFYVFESKILQIEKENILTRCSSWSKRLNNLEKNSTLSYSPHSSYYFDKGSSETRKDFFEISISLYHNSVKENVYIFDYNLNNINNQVYIRLYSKLTNNFLMGLPQLRVKFSENF